MKKLFEMKVEEEAPTLLTPFEEVVRVFNESLGRFPYDNLTAKKVALLKLIIKEHASRILNGARATRKLREEERAMRREFRPTELISYDSSMIIFHIRKNLPSKLRLSDAEIAIYLQMAITRDLISFNNNK